MDIKIEYEKMSNEFEKFHLKGLPFDAVLHHFTAPDIGGPHDHPFGFTSYVIKGSYVERVYDKDTGKFKDYFRPAGSSRYISAETIHEIIRLPDGDCYTIIIPYHKERETHFWKFEDGKVYNRLHNEREYKQIK